MKTAYQLAKAHYEANDRRDLAGMLADLARDCRWTEMDGFPCAGTFIGPEAVAENVFKAIPRQFDDYGFSLERLLDAGDDAVAIGSYSGTARRTGKTFTARVVHVWGAAGGKLTRFEQFTDTLRVAESLR